MGNCASSNVCSRGRRRRHQQQQQQQNATTITNEEPSDANIHTNREQANSPSFSNITSTSGVGGGANSLHSNDNTYSFNTSTSYPYYVPPTGKNKRLKKDFDKYFKFDKKITESQLRAKREEFWDTAPVFEGKAEIWNALKAAVEACEAKNFQLAQAIIDSANIILPNGLLNDCYDELGNRYQIPIYVLAKPINLIKSSDDKESSACLDDDSSFTSKNNTARGDNKKKKKKKGNKLDDDDEDEEDEDDEDVKISFRKRFFTPKCKSSKNSTKLKLTNLKKKSSQLNEGQVNKKPQITVEESFQIKIRVSTLNNESDLKLSVTPSQTVASVKQQVKELTGIEASGQRMFFGGKLMRDKDKVKTHKLKKNVVIQVIVRETGQQQTHQIKQQQEIQLNKLNDIENLNQNHNYIIQQSEVI